jgi:hypothetical protein
MCEMNNIAKFVCLVAFAALLGCTKPVRYTRDAKALYTHQVTIPEDMIENPDSLPDGQIEGESGWLKNKDGVFYVIRWREK